MKQLALPVRQIGNSVLLSIVVSITIISTIMAQNTMPDTSTYRMVQAIQGRTLYTEQCASCHGSDLEGGAAPKLIGPLFRNAWSRPNVTVLDLYYIISTTMPPGQKDVLTHDQYLDILSYILQRNGVPAGNKAIQPEAEYLLAIHMEADTSMHAPEFITGPNGLKPKGTGPDAMDLLHAADHPANWLYITRDYHGTRYSPLSQINRNNIAKLHPVCIYQVGDPGNFQTGPIIYNGTMYITGVHVTAAIDAATCQQKWQFIWQPKDRESWLNNRGVAIKDGYVVRGTADGYLVALDSKDGALLWARQIANPSIGETLTMAPMIYNDMILIGPAGSENGISGWVGAFQLVDGKPIWRFNTVPGVTRSGGKSWGNPQNILIGGGAVWTPLSLDPEKGELYVAVTNPAPDFSPNLRPGSNLYTNSIIALDVNTGKLLWYKQLVPADEHDWDLTQVSPIFQARVDGKMHNVVATAGKDGMLRVLDQTSHQIVYETAVTTRKNVDAPVTTEGTYACPGVLGGVEWNGSALDPSEGLLITPAVNFCSTFYADEPGNVRYTEGNLYLGGKVEMDYKSWSGWLTAVNIQDGSVRWKYKSPGPMVAAVTTTAGGLVLTGELTGDFLVLDAANGKPLYRFNTGGPVGGGIVSYSIDNRQYIAVASGSPSQFWTGEHRGSSTIIVFSLPK